MAPNTDAFESASSTAAETGRLDETDRSILAILQRNSKITNADLAKRVGVSPPTALERVKKLERRGVIRGYTALVDPASVNKTTAAIVHLSLREHGRQPLKQVRAKLIELDEVLACWHTAGEEDFILKVVVADMAEYERFVTNKLSAIKGVGRIRTTFVLNTCKEETRLPLDSVPT
ncbi:MAG: Lrp/AsnC family transcriptional regulator [Phycisphaerales bacterium]